MENHSARRGSGWIRSGLVVAAGLGLLACGGKSSGSTTKEVVMNSDTAVPKVDPTLCETAGKNVTTFDLNQDNKPDVWKLYKKMEEGGATLEVLTCKQVDFDHDGRKDYVAAYERKGGLVFEKFDFDFDGRFDAFAQYDAKTNVIVEVQRDSDFDGKYDLTEVYDKDGKLTTVRRDRNADSNADVWEQYAGGELVAILWDDDYDNKVDRREERKDLKPKSNLPLPEPEPEPEPAEDEGAPQ